MKAIVTTLVLISFCLVSCAHTETCQNAADEPVSMCRAKAACSGGGKFFASALSGMGGDSGTLERCINTNLSAQKQNAEFKSKQSQ